MNQTVSLCEFGTVGRAFFPACQTNCFQGEASAAYDPCGNMISLVANSSGAEVWARAVDKNSDATIGIYDPFNMEIPFSAQATINPSYDQPINGPIEIHIPEKGQWELEELLANQTKVKTTLGEMGISISIGGDDDCGDSICGEGNDACRDPESEWSSYCNCVRNCFGSDGANCSTDLIEGYQTTWWKYIDLKTQIRAHLIKISGLVAQEDINSVNSFVKLIFHIDEFSVSEILDILADYHSMSSITRIKVLTERKLMANLLSTFANYMGQEGFVFGMDQFIENGSSIIDPEVVFHYYLDREKRCRDKCSNYLPNS